jgi:hypothetical protein
MHRSQHVASEPTPVVIEQNALAKDLEILLDPKSPKPQRVQPEPVDCPPDDFARMQGRCRALLLRSFHPLASLYRCADSPHQAQLK